MAETAVEQSGGETSVALNKRGGNEQERRGGNTQNSVVANSSTPEVGVVANPHEPVVANSAVRVVANDEDEGDSDDVSVVAKPTKSARVEICQRKRKNGPVYILRWRWQLKDPDGIPLRTKSGGYRRGSRYVKTVTNKKDAKRFKTAAE